MLIYFLPESQAITAYFSQNFLIAEAATVIKVL